MDKARKIPIQAQRARMHPARMIDAVVYATSTPGASLVARPRIGTIGIMLGEIPYHGIARGGFRSITASLPYTTRVVFLDARATH